MMKLLAEDCIEIGEKIYFCGTDYNIVFSINTASNQIVLEDCIPDENAETQRLSSKLLLWDNELIFIPMNSHKLWRWNIESKEWHGVEIPTLGVNENKFLQAVIYDGELYMFGCVVPAIVCMNLRSEEIHIINEPFNNIAKKNKSSESSVFFRCNYVNKDGYIYMASCMDNSVMKFCLKNKSIEFVKVGNYKNQYSGIVFDGEVFWLSPRFTTNLVCWDEEKDRTLEIGIMNDMNYELSFAGINMLQENLFIMPGKINESIKIHKNKEKVELELIKKTYKFIKNYGNTMYFFEANGTFSVRHGTQKSTFAVEINSLDFWSFIKDRCNINKKIIRTENDLFGLKEFLITI